MNRECGFISVDDSRWKDALREMPHDVYHLPAYATLAAEAAEEAAAFLWRDGERVALIPLIIKASPSPVVEILSEEGSTRCYDAVSPYGYSGPITNRPGECEAEVLSAMRERARERGILTFFLRAHPLLSSSFQPTYGDGLSVIGTTYSVPLPEQGEINVVDHALLARYRSTTRSQIRTLLSRYNVQLTVDDWEWIDDFARLYRMNMERLGASASYFFSDGYFHNAQQYLAGSFRLVSALVDGEYIGGVALFNSGDIVQYHLAAAQDEWRLLGVTKLLIHHAAVWASQHGYREFHLGGGVGGSDDSLSHFKRGFGANPHPFSVYRIVVNEPSYKRLLSRLSVSGGDFFPPYRAPAVSEECWGNDEGSEGGSEVRKEKCPGRESNSHSVARTGF